MVYERIASGTVKSCSQRMGGYLVGIQVSDYCIAHYHTTESYRVGETVHVYNDPNFGLKLSTEALKQNV